ncbi:PKD repeat protein [Lacibacter cauensis]|uniref:PKD repeat protein n=1 Tax=Lacibacter cauensis TaxID=510947 RepID=A0A562S7T5_9BACT|nr:PKD domain-containing protein [Lacibacter cauensis]TWI77511.1 PKD repeat protein [Lacibacter cauensis]
MIKLKSILLFCLNLTIPITVLFAQQGNNWYFGFKAGLNFGSTPPLPLLDGQLNTKEGCSTISDTKGDLLFYTNGDTVYNKQHQIMANGTGLYGHISSFQSSIIIPRPGSDSLFYIFTADAQENTGARGYNYSVVDMSRQGGLGQVIEKNTLLYAPSSERMTAVRHNNGVDVWLITHVPVANEFRTFLITCKGVTSIPVSSFSGDAYPEDTRQGFRSDLIGVFKASPDGKLLITSTYSETGFAQLYSFNSATGIVSNAFRLPLRRLSIGAEFSADSKMLYVGDVFPGAHKIYQYDVSTYNPTNILNSRYELNVGTTVGSMQIGPDNKIYVVGRELDSFLHIIEQPQNIGAACSFKQRSISLSGRSAWVGLPSFMPSLFINQGASFDYSIQNDCSTVNFTGTSTLQGALNWYWEFGDGNTSTLQNPVHTYQNSGNIYNVTLRVSSNLFCGELKVGKPINLTRVIPEAGFAHTLQCGNYTVSFTDTSKLKGNFSPDVMWDFGDGATSTLQNPVHTYTSTGKFKVLLRIGNNATCGGFDTISKIISIEAKPIANFNHSTLCNSSPIQFTDISTISTGTISHWFWDFGDKSTSTQKNPVKTYSIAGNYTVKFVTVSGTGCVSDTVYRTIAVSSKPINSFTVSDTCISNITRFTGTSDVTNGNITGQWWDFGDSSVSNISNPFHTYTVPGNYRIRFVTMANTGCASDTLSRFISIGSKPLAAIASDEQCGNKQVNFNSQSSNQNQPLTGWHWSFGDTNTGIQENISHTYNAFDDYQVKLVVVSSFGCVSDTARKVIQVNAKPTANPQYIDGCLGAPIEFTDNSSIESGFINQRHWILGDGTTSQQKLFTKTFQTAGDLEIKLAVTSDRNCVSDTVTRQINIESKPIANFSIADGCVSDQLQIINQSNIGTGTIIKHFWDFGDNSTATVAQPIYRYGAGGNYSVRYMTESKNGCKSDTVKNTVLIETKPVVDFSFGSTCAGKEVIFQNISNNQAGTIIAWQWNFGNGENSGLYQPTVTYVQHGIYPVSLTARTYNGCSATLSKSITIRKVNIFAGRDTVTAIGQPLQLSGSGASSYNWSPPQYLDNPTIANPVAILPVDMNYILSAITDEGCIGVDTISIKVYKGPEIFVPTAFVPEGINRVFMPILIGMKALISFEVYNRWGQRVYQTNKFNEGWNGQFNGKAQVAGMYIWNVRALDYMGIMHHRKGNVVLIR